MESLTANIDYINDSISDCQANIMQMEEAKVGQILIEIIERQKRRTTVLALKTFLFRNTFCFGCIIMEPGTANW